MGVWAICNATHARITRVKDEGNYRIKNNY